MQSDRLQLTGQRARFIVQNNRQVTSKLFDSIVKILPLTSSLNRGRRAGQQRLSHFFCGLPNSQICALCCIRFQPDSPPGCSLSLKSVTDDSLSRTSEK